MEQRGRGGTKSKKVNYVSESRDTWIVARELESRDLLEPITVLLASFFMLSSVEWRCSGFDEL